jgi:cyclopropane-fatty-acyl-phospholipid synthase
VNGRLRKFLERVITDGSLEITDAGGTTHRFGDGKGKRVRVRFTSRAAERAVMLNPELHMGEQFMLGGYVMDAGSIYDLLKIFFASVEGVQQPLLYRIFMNARYATRRARQFNTPLRSRRNVKSHYDLTGELYRLFLDDDLQYSCAYFETDDATLAEAQLAKKRHIAAKLNLKPGQRVLDIGSGWGGLALYLAEQFDVSVTGITLSDEQLAVARQRARERGLEHRVDFRLEDYRKIEGPFDRIVSVGMFEHVGVSHFGAFFRTCRDLMPRDGVMLLHSIGRFDGPGETSKWIQKYIFPGGYIPALSEVVPSVEKSRLLMTDIEILRLHYAETLRAWRHRFLENREGVKALYDERFCRMWEFYLSSSEVAFRHGGLMNFQIQMTRNLEAVPLTRGYSAAAEELLRNDNDSTPRERFELAGE